jgi:hypothetical protein
MVRHRLRQRHLLADNEIEIDEEASCAHQVTGEGGSVGAK